MMVCGSNHGLVHVEGFAQCMVQDKNIYGYASPNIMLG